MGISRRLLLLLLIAAFFAANTEALARTKPRPKKPAVPALPALPPRLTPGELPLAATSAVLMDAASGELVYEKFANQTGFPASATKILTGLLVIEAGDLEREVIIQPPDTKVEPSSLGFKPGDVYTRRNLLYSLLLKSANDASLALARDNAGSVELFLEKMNRRAAELGATQSHFKNPHGLHHKEHYVTALDLAKIARYAMTLPLFRQIVATSVYRFGEGEKVTEVRNHNKLLAKVPECTGIKTGYTIAAQQVLVSSAKRQGREFISVVLHTNKPGIWEDSKMLLQRGFEKFGLLPDPPDTSGCTFPQLPPKPPGKNIEGK